MSGDVATQQVVPQRQRTCRERWAEHKRGRVSDLRRLWRAYCEGRDEEDPDLGRFEEYGLSFDYVEPGTFRGQAQGYWRYQLSWGGPSDEFRFYVDDHGHMWRVEYWFLDWFDGHGRKLRCVDEAILREMWEGYFAEAARSEAAS